MSEPQPYTAADIKTPAEIQAKLDEMGYKKGDTILAQNWRGSETIGDGFKISKRIGELAGLHYGVTEESIIIHYPFEMYKGTHSAQIKVIASGYFRVLYEFFGFRTDEAGKLVWLINRRKS